MGAGQAGADGRRHALTAHPADRCNQASNRGRPESSRPSLILLGLCMKRTASITVLVASGLLAACSSTNPMEKQLDYKSDTPNAKNTLEVPPDLTMPQIQN